MLWISLQQDQLLQERHKSKSHRSPSHPPSTSSSTPAASSVTRPRQNGSLCVPSRGSPIFSNPCSPTRSYKSTSNRSEEEPEIKEDTDKEETEAKREEVNEDDDKELLLPAGKKDKILLVHNEVQSSSCVLYYLQVSKATCLKLYRKSWSV